MTSEGGLSGDTRATALLCGHFGARRDGPKPLTPAQFPGCIDALEVRGLGPAALLGGELGAPGDLLRLGSGAQPSAQHIAALLARGRELDGALAKWWHAGIWIISEYDPQYPTRLRDRLGRGGFPLLFGAGPLPWLDRGGVCIVGSRDCPEPGLDFARTLASRCAREDMTVISSDMRGVDREAITAALRNDGRVLSVLSDSLEKAVAAKRNRVALETGALTLVTPFSPDSRFSVSNAMRANKYQYALSDVAVVVETRRKGGVWSGADENRNEAWVPAFVRAGESVSPGNTALIHLGSEPITLTEVQQCPSLETLFLERALQTSRISRGRSAPGASTQVPDLYAEFLRGLHGLCANSPATEADVMNTFVLERSQARRWLARALAEGTLEKLQRPARYRVPENQT